MNSAKKQVAFYRIGWRCPECGRSGVTPEVRQSGPWADIERVLVRLHRSAAPGCPGMIGNFDLEFRRVKNSVAPLLIGAGKG